MSQNGNLAEQLNFHHRVVSNGSIKAKSTVQADVLPIGQASGDVGRGQGKQT